MVSVSPAANFLKQFTKLVTGLSLDSLGCRYVCASLATFARTSFVKIKYAVNRTAGKYLNATCTKRLVMVELVLLQLSIEFLRLVVIR